MHTTSRHARYREGDVKSVEIEYLLADLFNYRQNLIVPNVSYGLGFSFEADLVVVTAAGYGTEIEIKTSKADLLRDFKKGGGWKGGKWFTDANGKVSLNDVHRKHWMKRFYFAMPKKMEKYMDVIPDDCGVILAGPLWEIRDRPDMKESTYWKMDGVRIVRPAKAKKVFPISEKDKMKLAHLGCMRVWDAKKAVRRMQQRIQPS